MSEEEKEAIEYWKRHIELLHYNTQFASEHYATILLNYISKLQKEIEQKQETIDKIMKELEEFYKKYDIISKDKIRAEIKELENKKEQYSEQPLIYHILKSQLEELLGE